jgi:hypothetical protein
MDKKANVILGAGFIAFAIILFPMAGYAATGTSDTSSKTASTTAAKAKALISMEKETTAEAAPSQESVQFQKKMANLSQDKLIEPPAPKAEPEAQSEPEKPKPVKRTTSGIVTGISPQGIAIEYAVDKKEGGREVWLNYGDVADKNSLSDIGEGDTVNAVFDEYPDRRKMLTDITLERKKPKERAEAEEI